MILFLVVSIHVKRDYADLAPIFNRDERTPKIIEDACKISKEFSIRMRRVVPSNCSNVLIENSSFYNIKSTLISIFFRKEAGGAIYLKSQREVKILGTTFEDIYSSDNGGAIYFHSVSTINSIDNTFDKCECKWSGGALYVGNCSSYFKIANNLFTSSSCRLSGGAIFIDSSQIIFISNSNIFNSLVTSGNGGSFMFSCIKESLHIEDSILSNSKSSLGIGGAFSLYDVTNCLVNNSQFISCSASNYGGTIYLDKSSTIIMQGNHFIDCTLLNSSSMDLRYGGVLYAMSTTPVILKSNTFESSSGCYNGLIGFDSTYELNVISNIFRNCTTRDVYGGAIYTVKYDQVYFSKNYFYRCNSLVYGGAIYFERDEYDTSDVRLVEDQFEFCSSYYGGSISLKNIKSITMEGVKFIKCNSSQGGALFIDNLSNLINIKNSEFINCSAVTNGGGIFCGPGGNATINVSNCTYNICICTYGNGGALNMEKGVIAIRVDGCLFLSCKAEASGAAFYYHYDYLTSASMISIASTSNIFEDCESEEHGSFTIDSEHIHYAKFENDVYKNCRAVGDSGQGGGVLVQSSGIWNFSFVNCTFSRCSAKDKYGAIGCNMKYDSSRSPFRIIGCSFDNCDANEATCVGIELDGPSDSSTSLSIEGNDGIFTTFTSDMPGNKHAIAANVAHVQISQTKFDCRGIGVIKYSGENISIKHCLINNSKSTTGIINCPSLTTLLFDAISYENCENCFNIRCTGISNISNLTFNNSESESKRDSILESNNIRITNITLSNNKEPILLITNSSIDIIGGHFSNNDGLITVTGNNISDTSLVVRSLVATNSLLFVVDEISNFSMFECSVFYDQQPMRTEGSMIKVCSCTYSDISFCDFSTKGIPSIEYTSLSTNGSLINCIFNVSSSPIKVGNTLTLSNCSFNSSGHSLEITDRAGVIKLDADTNCFSRKRFSDAISIGEGKVTDIEGTNITKFNYSNNRCYVPLPTTDFFPSFEFTESSNFLSSSMFTSSLYFEPSTLFMDSKSFKSTETFTYTHNFKSSIIFTRSNVFKQSYVFTCSLTHAYNHKTSVLFEATPNSSNRNIYQASQIINSLRESHSCTPKDNYHEKNSISINEGEKSYHDNYKHMTFNEGIKVKTELKYFISATYSKEIGKHRSTTEIIIEKSTANRPNTHDPNSINSTAKSFDFKEKVISSIINIINRNKPSTEEPLERNEGETKNSGNKVMIIGIISCVILVIIIVLVVLGILAYKRMKNILYIINSSSFDEIEAEINFESIHEWD